MWRSHCTGCSGLRTGPGQRPGCDEPPTDPKVRGGDPGPASRAAGRRIRVGGPDSPGGGRRTPEEAASSTVSAVPCSAAADVSGFRVYATTCEDNAPRGRNRAKIARRSKGNSAGGRGSGGRLRRSAAGAAGRGTAGGPLEGGEGLLTEGQPVDSERLPRVARHIAPS